MNHLYWREEEEGVATIISNAKRFWLHSPSFYSMYPVHTWVETRMRQVSQHADQPRVRLSQSDKSWPEAWEEASQSLPQALTRSSILSL